MMYYRLKEYPKAVNYLRPKMSFQQDDIWNHDSPQIVQPDCDYGTLLQEIPFIEHPPFVISHKTKEIFEQFQVGLQYKPCIMPSKPGKDVAIYYFMKPFVLDCMDEHTEFHKDGTVKQLVLNQELIGDHKIFQVAWILERYLIIDLDIAEILLNEGVYPIELIEIDSV